jgi:hypothetical protein
LEHLLDYLKSHVFTSVYSIHSSVISKWFKLVLEDLQVVHLDRLETIYGGPSFSPEDKGSYWSEVIQFTNWWKNNVERKVKFKVFQEDALYRGEDSRKLQR